jgi:hypothetical protein
MTAARPRHSLLAVFALTAALVPVMAGTAGAGLVPSVSINEVRIDQTSTDDDEYFELSGSPGTSLDGLTYLVIGDGTGGSGVIEEVLDLTGQTIPSSGFFVAAESTFTLGTADLTASLNFENGDNVTHLLVAGFSGSDGDDLDTDDDGTLDATPWASVVDLIALVEEANPPTGTEYHYGPPSVGPDGEFVPGHAFFCPGGWQIGAFNPAGGDDTPGSANDCPTPGAVVINEVRIDQPSTDDDEYFELSGSPGTSLDGLTYLVIGDGTGGSGVIEAVVDLSGETIPGSGFFTVAESTFTLGTVNLVASLNFENSDNVTHLLVAGFSGAGGDDLDTDDDGTLDVTPWASVVDLIALVEEANPPAATEYHYGPPSVGPDGSFVPGHAFFCPGGWEIGAFDPAGGDDTPGTANDCDGGDGGDEFGSCFDGLETSIHDIQGPGFTSPDVGVVRTVEGVVTGDFEGFSSLAGFFMQEEDADHDADSATSEGIFVFNGSGDDVAAGDIVRVRGTVTEFFGLTEIEDLTDLVICDTGGTVTTTPLTGPVPDADREAVEGMQVGFTDTLFVTDTFNLHTFGEVWLGMGGVIEQPTNEHPAGAAADALAAENIERSILLDDTEDGAASSIPYLHANGTLRLGDTTTDLVGIMSYGFGQYRIRPLTVSFAETNPRTAAPDPGGDVVVAAFNVLNYWTTIGCGFECRGAQTQAQLDVQTEKLVAAIMGMNADIVGLVEVENPPEGSDISDPGDSAHLPITTLLDALNAEEGSEVWAWVGPADHYNAYPIRNEIIYRIGAVTPVGSPTAYSDPAFDDIAPSGDPFARPPLAQTFDADGAVFSVVVNHFKSKGSPCNEPNEGVDGQGNCNLQRIAESEALLDFVSDLQAIDPNVLVIGDLNAYMEEDPVHTLEGELVNLVTTYESDPYSYNFFATFSFPYVGRGSLDHALGTSTMAAQVTGVATWHINADEPRFLDWFDPSITAPGPYRSSDHDPVLLGLDLDDEAPELDVSVSPETLWPPNQKYRDVEVTIVASDDSGSVMVELVSAVSSEADSGLGDGDLPDDIVVIDDTHFELRAERYSLAGRTYTLTYRAYDAAGNETFASVEVVVPHSQGKGPQIV